VATVKLLAMGGASSAMSGGVSLAMAGLDSGCLCYSHHACTRLVYASSGQHYLGFPATALHTHAACPACPFLAA
jgi:hypothetical protein